MMWPMLCNPIVWYSMLETKLSNLVRKRDPNLSMITGLNIIISINLTTIHIGTGNRYTCNVSLRIHIEHAFWTNRLLWRVVTPMLLLLRVLAMREVIRNARNCLGPVVLIVVMIVPMVLILTPVPVVLLVLVTIMVFSLILATKLIASLILVTILGALATMSVFSLILVTIRIVFLVLVTVLVALVTILVSSLVLGFIQIVSLVLVTILVAQVMTTILTLSLILFPILITFLVLVPVPTDLLESGIPLVFPLTTPLTAVLSKHGMDV